MITKCSLKLINNERKSLKILSAKSCGTDSCGNSDYATCAGTSTDICKYIDAAACIGITTYDYCGWDYSVCVGATNDICYETDNKK